jgi:hypothetical protein
MGSTRTEQAVDEMGIEDDDDVFGPSCDDIRLAWLARAPGAEHAACSEHETPWCDL